MKNMCASEQGRSEASCFWLLNQKRQKQLVCSALWKKWDLQAVMSPSGCYGAFAKDQNNNRRGFWDTKRVCVFAWWSLCVRVQSGCKYLAVFHGIRTVCLSLLPRQPCHRSHWRREERSDGARGRKEKRQCTNNIPDTRVNTNIWKAELELKYLLCWRLGLNYYYYYIILIYVKD